MKAILMTFGPGGGITPSDVKPIIYIYVLLYFNLYSLNTTHKFAKDKEANYHKS